VAVIAAVVAAAVAAVTVWFTCCGKSINYQDCLFFFLYRVKKIKGKRNKKIINFIKFTGLI